MNELKLRIHFLVPDDVGIIQSGTSAGPVPIGTETRYRVACDPTIKMNDWNRGTHEPWGVRCLACMDTEIFKELDRPKPGRTHPDRSEETPVRA